MHDYQPRHRADVPIDYIRIPTNRRTHPGAHRNDRPSYILHIARDFAPATELTAPTPGGPRAVTPAEVAALTDPGYLARMIADNRDAGMVEVDNPFRREVRPRRGTEPQ